MFALGQMTLMMYYITLCHFFAAIAPNMVIGQVFAGLSFSLLQLFSGLFIPVGQMGGWQFMYYIVRGARPPAHARAQLASLARTATAQPPPPPFTARPAQVGTSWALKFMALPQFYVNPLLIPDANYFATTVFSASQSDIWPSFGWLILIIVVLRLFGFLGYRFINFTRR